MSCVTPSSVTSRSTPLMVETLAAPTITGTTRETAGRRATAAKSASERSRGVSPMIGGGPPTVSLRPGMTISRFVPSAENSPVT